MKASVIIPTKNAGPLFKQVLDKVLDQDTPWDFEVFVIDSGSNDGTVEYARSKDGVRVHEILPEEFGHGKTRNLAISLTQGEFAVMLTHDALPAHRLWLKELVSAVEQSDDIAGAFGRHIAYSHDGPFIERDLKAHFDGFLAWPEVVRMDDPQRYEVDQGYRQFLHFYSDNNSCLRRSVWEQIPYPDVDFAEDQLWAKQVIEAGYAKAYAHNAVVYHSHNFGFVEWGRRSFDEARALKLLFGYDLCPSLLHMIAQSVRTTYSDFVFLKNERKIFSESAWLLRSPLVNSSRQLGFYLGQRYMSLPNFVVSRFSRDMSLKGNASIRYTLLRYWGQFKAVKTKLGFYGASKYAVRRFLQKKMDISSMSTKSDPVGFYNFIYKHSFGGELVKKDDDVNITVNWVIPDFGIGSGGHLNIFRIIKKLEDRGIKCRVNIDGESHFSNGDDARECIRKHFFDIEAEVGIGRKELKPADATFATGWTTAYTVRDFKGAGKKYYFVQDFEPYFSALGSDYVFAEQTYKFGFKAITAGDWLADKLKNEYGMETASFGFSYDRELYVRTRRREPEIKRVFFYARPVTPRRSMELGLLTLAKVHESHPDIEFVLAGWDMSGYEVPFPFLNAGVLPLSELPDLYSQCDVALVLSMTNLSLLPLEVMACGCAVVSNKGPNVEWLLNENIASLSEPTPEELSLAITELFDNPSQLESLKKKGMEFALSTSWDVEVDKIIRWLESDLKVS